jgi:hypothetical protein
MRTRAARRFEQIEMLLVPVRAHGTKAVIDATSSRKPGSRPAHARPAAAAYAAAGRHQPGPPKQLQMLLYDG